jgi:hypothetical protein
VLLRTAVSQPVCDSVGNLIAADHPSTSSQYYLATSLLIPTAFYIPIALASILLIFPETLNHAVL